MTMTMRRSATFVVIGAVTVLGLLAGTPASVRAAGGNEERTPPAPVMSAPQDPAYADGVKAIKAGDYSKAIQLLQTVVSKDEKNADAFNWLAYATRKNGDPTASIPIYRKALAINPKHKGAHEYIGEAYLMLGDLAKAKEHLATLDKLCFFSCEEYRDLKAAIAAYEKKAGK